MTAVAVSSDKETSLRSLYLRSLPASLLPSCEEFTIPASIRSLTHSLTLTRPDSIQGYLCHSVTRSLNHSSQHRHSSSSSAAASTLATLNCDTPLHAHSLITHSLYLLLTLHFHMMLTTVQVCTFVCTLHILKMKPAALVLTRPSPFAQHWPCRYPLRPKRPAKAPPPSKVLFRTKKSLLSPTEN